MAQQENIEPILDSRLLAILQLTSEGFSSAATGKELCIGEDNMETLRGQIIVKLGAKNMYHAVGEGLRKGLIK